VDFAQAGPELSTDDWLSVIRQARAMGAAQFGISGGEPLLRDDIEILVTEARKLGFYTNLITSGVGLNEARLAALKDAGLDHIQLSFQDATREANDLITNTRTFDLKRKVAALTKAAGYPTVINCVLHRGNIDHLDRIVEMAAGIGAEFLELANTQYHGWAFLNRAALMPTEAQLAEAERVTERWRQKLGKAMRILFVTPDYQSKKPKKCMNGWGEVFLAVTPDGLALPCHTARMLPGLEFPDVRQHSIEWIWRDSPLFNRYRGTAWLPETCQTCDDKDKDHGGCRCQAYMLTGNPDATDPVCPKSPDHRLVAAALAEAERPGEVRPLVFRDPQESRRLARPF
jgi:pyrroloquinoline quinone biosynthesis protein E